MEPFHEEKATTGDYRPNGLRVQFICSARTRTGCDDQEVVV